LNDLHGSSDYRANLIKVMAKRALAVWIVWRLVTAEPAFRTDTHAGGAASPDHQNGDSS
jgi:hypothetical protein